MAKKKILKKFKKLGYQVVPYEHRVYLCPQGHKDTIFGGSAILIAEGDWEIPKKELKKILKNLGSWGEGVFIC